MAARRTTAGTHPSLRPVTVRAALRAQIGTALAQIRNRAPSDEEVHSARKCIKKARATLRLLRELIGTPIYRRENQALRDAARTLSAARDIKVLLDILQAMVKRCSLDPTSADVLRRSLIRKRKRLHRQAISRAGVTHARRALRAVERRASRWNLSQADVAPITEAVRKTYKRGRRGQSLARANPTVALMHEWRKQVKYLWHQLQMLEPLSAELVAMAEMSHRLSDYLGEDHDLAVLRAVMIAKRHLLSARPLQSALTSIDRRRQMLEKKAFGLGRRLYSEKSPGFVRERRAE